MADENTETTVETPTETAQPEAPAQPAAWGGSWDDLDKQPWVPEDAKPHITKLRDTYSSLSSRAEFLDKFFQSDDAASAAAREADSLREALAKAETGHKDALAKVQTEFDTFRSQVEEERAGRLFERLRTTYADIFDEKLTKQDEKGNWTGPWQHLYTLLENGVDEETAAKMVRATLPQPEGPPKTRDVKVPPAMAAANLTSHTPSATVNSKEANENFEQRADRLVAEAQARGA